MVVWSIHFFADNIRLWSEYQPVSALFLLIKMYIIPTEPALLSAGSYLVSTLLILYFFPDVTLIYQGGSVWSWERMVDRLNKSRLSTEMTAKPVSLKYLIALYIGLDKLKLCFSCFPN